MQHIFPLQRFQLQHSCTMSGTAFQTKQYISEIPNVSICLPSLSPTVPFYVARFFFLLPLWQGSLMYDWSHSAFQYRVLWTLVVLWDPVLDRWAQHGLSHILTTVILQHFFHFNWHTQECFYLIYTGVVCHYFILHCFKCCKFVILVTLSHILQDAVQYSCTVYILLASSAEFLFLQLFVHTHYTSVTMCPLFMFAPCINSIKNTFIIPTDAHYYKNQTVKTI